MADQEQFECLNCTHVGALDRHGACDRCGSQSVMSVERIMVLAENARRAAEHQRMREKFTFDDRYVIEAAGFWLERFNPSAGQAEDAA